MITVILYTFETFSICKLDFAHIPQIHHRIGGHFIGPVTSIKVPSASRISKVPRASTMAELASTMADSFNRAAYIRMEKRIIVLEAGIVYERDARQEAESHFQESIQGHHEYMTLAHRLEFAHQKHLVQSRSRVRRLETESNSFQTENGRLEAENEHLKTEVQRLRTENERLCSQGSSTLKSPDDRSSQFPSGSLTDGNAIAHGENSFSDTYKAITGIHSQFIPEEVLDLTEEVKAIDVLDLNELLGREKYKEEPSDHGDVGICDVEKIQNEESSLNRSDMLTGSGNQVDAGIVSSFSTNERIC